MGASTLVTLLASLKTALATALGRPHAPNSLDLTVVPLQHNAAGGAWTLFASTSADTGYRDGELETFKLAIQYGLGTKHEEAHAAWLTFEASALAALEAFNANDHHLQSKEVARVYREGYGQSIVTFRITRETV